MSETDKLKLLFDNYSVKNNKDISFEKYTKIVYTILNNIYNIYILKYFCSEYVIMLEDENKVIKIINDWYQTNEEQDFSIQNVFNVLLNNSDVNLNNLVKIKLYSM